MITISELATSALLQARTPGKGRVQRSGGKERAPKAQRDGAGLKERSSVLWSHDGIPRRPGLGGPARVAYLLLPRRGEPKRGAASRASEASRLASTWAAEKFAQTHRERLAAPDSGDRCEFEVCGWSPGLATPGGAPAAAASGMLRARR